MARLSRAVKRILIWGGVPGLLLLGTLFFMVRTGPGQRFVLERVLGAARERIQGTITVSGIRSPSLLDQMMFIDVRIQDPAGRPLLEADSLGVRYSLWGLVRGDLQFADLELWGPRLTVERLPGQSEMNAVRIFSGGRGGQAPTGEEDRPEGGGLGLDFRNVRLHGGEVLVRLPLEEGEVVPTALVEEVPGGRVRTFSVRDIQAHLPRIRIGDGGDVDEVVESRSLSFDAHVRPEPFRIRDFRGRLWREGSRLSMEAERLWLPDTELGGGAMVDWGDPRGLVVSAELEATAVDLRDFRWIEPRLPEAGGAFDLQLEMAGGTALWTFTDLDLLAGDSRVRGRVGIRTGEGPLRLVDSDLLAEPLELSYLEPWLETPLPVQGSVRGRLSLDGRPEELRVAGRLTLEESGVSRPPSTAEIDGTLHLAGGPLGATDLTLVLAPFQFGLAARFDERLALRGPGSVRLTADGRFGGDLRFSARIAHRPRNLPHSSIQLQGTTRGSGDTLRLDVNGQLEPLSFTALAAYYPQIPLSGEATGSVQLQGPVSDLDLRTRLATPGGVLPLAARLDARDPGAGYRLEADVEDFEISTVVPSLPGPSVITGRTLLVGRGLHPDSLEATGELDLRGSRVGHLRLDSLSARFRASAGTLLLDTIVARTSAMDAEGRGTLALTETVPSGEIELELTSDSLGGLRPFLLGDTVIARDTLSAIERNLLEMEGIDPDTLPTAEAVIMDGRLSGRGVLRGSVTDFSLQGFVRVEEVVYGYSFLRGADLEFNLEGLPELGSRLEARLVADSVRVGDRRFAGGEATLEYTRPEGRLDLLVRRSDEEDYRVRAAFEADSLGGVVHLEDLTLRFEPVHWSLAEPATVSWDENGVTVQDFQLVRPEEQGMRLMAEGRLPVRGEADFRLTVDSLPLGRLSRLAQAERSLEGTVGLRMRVLGSAASPVIDGTVEIRELAYDSISFSRVQGGIRYRDRAMTVGLLAWRGDAVALTVEGIQPVDLSFREVETRFPDEEMDLKIRVSALPAEGVLSFLDALENVGGVLNGELRVAGTLQDPAPSGTIRLQDGRASFPALGIDVDATRGTFELTPDGTIRIDAQARSAGVARIQGTVGLNPASNPSLDLRITARGFQGVNRRDVTAQVGGEVTVGGTYRRPLVQGEVTVDQGVLFLEEFARGAQVVDLSDPAFFDVVDTSLVAMRPLLAESQNPFLSNLRVDVDLGVERDSWIRSSDMDVELQGDLTVVYDRTSRDLALLGQLQAVRGSYNAYGRRFEVQEGTVEFVGTPGLNPSLDIVAVTRLRRPSQEPLNIAANVQGTLINPRIELSSDAQPAISQPDLVSYLIFGRPAGLLAPGERSVAGGAGQLLGGIASAGASLGLGTLTAQLSSAVAQEIGFFDYFAITTGQDSEVVGSSNPLAQTFTQSLASAQVEVGRYFFEDVFIAVLLRPLTGLTGTERVSRPGVRMEWRFADLWTVEGFVEDRFARTASTGFGDLGFRPEQVLGLTLFREWGY